VSRQRVLLAIAGAVVLVAVALPLHARQRVMRRAPRKALLRVIHGSEDIEVLINDRLVAQIAGVQRGQTTHPILFDDFGRTRFGFVIKIAGQPVYRAEAARDVQPGAMLDFSYALPALSSPAPTFESKPDFSAAALLPGHPPRMWCWFGPANLRTDVFSLKVGRPQDAAAVIWRLRWRGYSIAERRPIDNDTAAILRVAPPSHGSVLAGYLEARTWRDVYDVKLLRAAAR